MSNSSFDDRPDELIDESYRPLNTLAVVALFVSVLSLFALANLLVVAMSVFGMILALTALYIGRPRENRNQGMAGNFLAYAALWLSVFSAVCGVTAELSKQRYLGQHAIKYSRIFLDELFAQNFHSMYEFAKDPTDRLTKGKDLNKHYQRTILHDGEQYPPAFEIVAWKQMQPTKAMLDDNLEGKLELIGIGEFDRDLRHDIIGVDYRYTPASPENPELEFRVFMLRREYTKPLFVQWQSKTFEILKGPRDQTKIEMYDIQGKKESKTIMPGQKPPGKDDANDEKAKSRDDQSKSGGDSKQN